MKGELHYKQKRDCKIAGLHFTLVHPQIVTRAVPRQLDSRALIGSTQGGKDKSWQCLHIQQKGRCLFLKGRRRVDAYISLSKLLEKRPKGVDPLQIDCFGGLSS